MSLYWQVAVLCYQCRAVCQVYICELSLSFYVVTAIYIKELSAVCDSLPVAMDSSCAKTPSNGLPDRTAHGLVSCNQRASRLDVIMARQTPPVSSYYGTCPFNVTISHNSVITNSITSVLGLNDGKTCTLYINTNAPFLHKELKVAPYT